MKLCIANIADKKDMLKIIETSKYILESFYYIKEFEIPIIKKTSLFLLDSGAFTFMQNSKTKVNWEEYINKYANFINKNNIKYFFELDIDSVVGIEEVERLRNILETKTKKKCIPVWHKSRGLEYWKKMCKNYDYVAIGGIVTKEIKKTDYKYLPKLLKIAKENNCKVHGLGFTPNKNLLQYNFFSVDSTSWKSGGRFGQLHLYKNGQIISIKEKNKRASDYKKIDNNNLKEWIKYQKYLDKR